MKIICNEIGDGLFLEIASKKNGLIVDFGSQQDIRPYDMHLFLQANWKYSMSNFALSHYHTDHYSGLFDLEKIRSKTQFSNIYITRIPDFPRNTDFIQAYLAVAFYTLGNDSGSMDYDFINLITKINKKPFQIIPVSQGDVINVGGESLEVSWPPRHASTDLSAKVREVLGEFEKKVAQNDILREIYNRLRQEQFIEIKGDSRVIEERDVQERTVNNSLPRLDITPQKREERVDEMKSINAKLRNIANRLSLSFFNDKLNFLGDLECHEIDNVLQYIQKVRRLTSWDVIILPHHGTHFHDSQLSIKGDIGISSIGHRLISHWKEQNRVVCETNLLTHLNGTIKVKIKPTIKYRKQRPYDFKVHGLVPRIHIEDGKAWFVL